MGVLAALLMMLIADIVGLAALALTLIPFLLLALLGLSPILLVWWAFGGRRRR